MLASRTVLKLAALVLALAGALGGCTVHNAMITLYPHNSDWDHIAQLTGDRNPIHLSEHFAAKTSFGRRIAHGLYTASLISAVLGTRLPGPGAIYISQTLNFRAPVKIGDTVVVTVTVRELIPEKSRARLSCSCAVDGEVVLDGEALVKVPSEKSAKGKRPVIKF